MAAAEAGPATAPNIDTQLETRDTEAAESRLPASAPPQQGEEPASKGVAAAAQPPPEAPMSKNALKRLRRQQEWENGKEDRRKRRREKRHDRRDRQREERATLLAQGVDPAAVVPRRKQQQAGATLVPVALIVDCDFEDYMSDKELVSLASQATRCYSDNRNARYKSHLWMAGWAGKIRDRFRNVLGGQHQHWNGVGFVEGDFLACADDARQRMKDRPGEMIASLQRGRRLDGSGDKGAEKDVGGEGEGGATSWVRDAPDDEPFPLPDPDPELNEAYRDVVYLTSESPYTLQRLEPHTSYVIGGLVDRNREKGLCYRRARERGIRTARLPIGQFMVMQSRQVLATNHVVEIMLKWLACEDWGEAFMAVIPKRKGGRLIGPGGTGEGDDEDEAGDESVVGENHGRTGETPATAADASGGGVKESDGKPA